MSVNNSDYSYCHFNRGKNGHSDILVIKLGEYNHINSIKLTIITILVNKCIYIMGLPLKKVSQDVEKLSRNISRESF